MKKKKQTTKKSAKRSYGRQAKHKTLKSLSLEKEVCERIEAEAAKQGISFSQFVNDFLKGTLKIRWRFRFGMVI